MEKTIDDLQEKISDKELESNIKIRMLELEIFKQNERIIQLEMELEMELERNEEPELVENPDLL